jgi:hypothetical protein
MHKHYTFKYIQDSGHGWLRVPHSIVWDLDLTACISHFSYQDSRYYFLEEDSDASKLLLALKEKGITYSLVESHCDYWQGRNRKESYSPRAVIFN